MTPEAIEQLYDEFHTPVHIRAHCFEVARIGKLLAEKLNKKGQNIDADLVWIAGMLHDLVRVVDFTNLDPNLGTDEDQWIWKKLRETYKETHHGIAAGEILVKIGEAKLADIIKRHAFGSIGTPEGPQDWESKLLYYADKRVAHDQCVSLQSRLDEARIRHNGPIEKTDKQAQIEEKIHQLESEIFKTLDFKPSDLLQLLGEN
jgi:uncharacterized protein